MSKIDRLFEFPIAKPFPSLDFGAENTIPKPFPRYLGSIQAKDTFASTAQKSKFSLKKFLEFVFRHK